MALVVSLLTIDDDLRSFSRRIASMVNSGPMHLAHAVATGIQVYPIRSDSVGGTATLLRCEFRMRQTGILVSEQAACGVLERLRSHQILDAHYVDQYGVNLGGVDGLAEAG